MERCWQEDPDQRPSFTQLVKEIEEETKKLEARSAARKIGLQVTYVNVPRGNYYNSSDIDDMGVSAAARISSRQELSDGSLGPESGFASSSNRSTIPRKPAADPEDLDSGQERAVL